MPRFIDVSHPIEAGMKTYPGLPEPEVTVLLDYEESHEYYAGQAEFCIAALHLCGNTATYVDAPIHRFRGAPDLASLPLESLAHLPVVVVRASGSIGPDAFGGRRLAGTAVLIETGWSRHWRTPRYFEPNPHLTEEACRLLRDEGVKLVGIDSVNIDSMADLRRPAHTTLLAAGIPICEHMTNLAAVPDEGGHLHAVPIPRVRRNFPRARVCDDRFVKVDDLPLHSRTPLEWGREVLADPIALLIDHAFLEKKAANNAMELMTRWPNEWVDGWVETMTSVARDETAHLAQVTRLLFKRGGRLERIHKNPYANALRLLVRKGEAGEILDRLMVSALIEARSCERFSVLAQASQDQELAAFYQALGASELGHYKVFLRLAAKIAGRKATDIRWQEMLQAEAWILAEQPAGPRIHSGLRQ